MNHKKFESKYGINELVEVKASGVDKANTFGHVLEITFHQSDAVNYAASYTINRVNTEEVKRSVPEHEILKGYVVK